MLGGGREGRGKERTSLVYRAMILEIRSTLSDTFHPHPVDLSSLPHLAYLSDQAVEVGLSLRVQPVCIWSGERLTQSIDVSGHWSRKL